MRRRTFPITQRPREHTPKVKSRTLLCLPVFASARRRRGTHYPAGDRRHFGPSMNKTKDTMGIVVQAVGDFLSKITEEYVGGWTSVPSGARSCGIYFAVSGPILTTSKSFPVRRFRVFNSSSFHRESGAPDRNQFPPLSARIIP